MTSQAVCIDPMQVRRVWPHVAPLIERAIARGGLSDFTGIAADVLEGRALLWLAWDGEEILGAAVTQLGLEPDGRKLCTIVACASVPSHAASPRHGRSLMPVSARPVRVDADLRDERGLQLRHGGTPSPQPKSDVSDFGQVIKRSNSGKPEFDWGEGGGEGARDSRQSVPPSPHPSPLRGEGAGRTRGSPVHAFARWGFLIAALERHAREEGCAAMRINGRRGWARVLKDYRTKAIVLEKELA